MTSMKRQIKKGLFSEVSGDDREARNDIFSDSAVLRLLSGNMYADPVTVSYGKYY